jgi:HK97 family phage portal protein
VEAKASRTGAVVALHAAGRPVWTPRNYPGLARAGYMKNAVVHRAVRLLSEAAAGVPWLLRGGAAELDDHPLLTLLRRPNPRQAGTEFLEQVYGHLLLAGNAYVEAVAVDGEVRELHALRPDRVSVVPDAAGWPAAYEYAANGRVVRFAQDTDGVAPILHLAAFHPLDDHYGLSPLEAAQMSLDVHNAANAWNKALLDNAARPSGALVYKGESGENLSEEQFERLREELLANFSGAGNAGRPLLLEGGLSVAGDEPVAAGDGFPGGEERRGARHRALLRGAADAVGHPRRQHLFQLQGGPTSPCGAAPCCR